LSYALYILASRTCELHEVTPVMVVLNVSWAVTQGMLEREIKKMRTAKAEHSGEEAGPKRRIGFQHG
jgi:hypothetical protein